MYFIVRQFIWLFANLFQYLPIYFSICPFISLIWSELKSIIESTSLQCSMEDCMFGCGFHQATFWPRTPYAPSGRPHRRGARCFKKCLNYWINKNNNLLNDSSIYWTHIFGIEISGWIEMNAVLSNVNVCFLSCLLLSPLWHRTPCALSSLHQRGGPVHSILLNQMITIVSSWSSHG